MQAPRSSSHKDVGLNDGKAGTQGATVYYSSEGLACRYGVSTSCRCSLQKGCVLTKEKKVTTDVSYESNVGHDWIISMSLMSRSQHAMTVRTWQTRHGVR